MPEAVALLRADLSREPTREEALGLPDPMEDDDGNA